MKKLLQPLALGFSVLLIASVCCSSCGKKKKKEQEVDFTAIENTNQLQPRTAELSIFSEMPVKGDQAEYFTILYPEGSQTITVTGTPNENSSSGAVRVPLTVQINKKFDDEIYEFDGLRLHFLDEDREDLGYIYMSSTDKELVMAELVKDEPSTVNLIFKQDEYSSSYNKIFDKAKYVRLEDADIKGAKEEARERAEAEKEAKAAEREARAAEKKAAREASASSSSRGSYDDDDDDDYEVDDSKSMKAAYKKAKEKVSSKAKDLKEKAAEKLNDWLDR